MKLFKELGFLLVLTLVFSCSSTKYLKFTKTPDDIVTTPSLKEFLNRNKIPKVVLRVSNTSYTVTDAENIDYLYNAIENQLVASGFIVRDRQLFNQIIANNDNIVDYQKLKSKSDTDLIIELTKLDPQILYETNKYFTASGQEKVEEYKTRKRYGASIEFKVILIESNEFAGIYKFNYTPCSDDKGCLLSKSMKDFSKEQKQKRKDGPKPYEGMERNKLELFIKDATKQLVAVMRT